MYTECPDCQTRFRVTAGALRAAHGTVRCGRCGSAFDALVRLSDAVPRAEPEVAPLPLLLATLPALPTGASTLATAEPKATPQAGRIDVKRLSLQLGEAVLLGGVDHGQRFVFPLLARGC